MTGIDDFQPLVGLIFILFWVLLLVAFGAALRQRRLGRVPSRDERTARTVAQTRTDT